MASEIEPAPDVSAYDTAVLSAGWTPELTGHEPVVLWEKGERTGGAVLLVAGTAAFTMETPLGPYTLCQLTAPCLVGVGELLMIGSGRLHGVTVGPRSAFVKIPASELRPHLLHEDPVGASCRRLALASLGRAIRRTNAGLGRFFSTPGREGAGHLPGAGPKPAASDPADSQKAGSLFETLGLDPRTLPNLGLRERRYAPGERLASEGEEADEAFLIETGRVRVSKDIAGQGEEALGFCEAGEFVGEMALLDRSARSADLIAHEGPVSVFVLSRDVFRALLDHPPRGSAPLLSGIAMALSLRLEQAIKRSVALFVMSGGNTSSEMPPAGFLFGEDETADEG